MSDIFGVGLDGCFELVVVVGIYKGRLYAILAQSVCQQIVSAAVYGFAGNNMIAGKGYVGDGIGYGSGS